MALMRVMLPYTYRSTPAARWRVGLFVAPVHVMSLQYAAASTVTVCPARLNELASKTTGSAEVGREAPGAPPEVADQWLMLSDQLPESPTQKRLAIQHLRGVRRSGRPPVLDELRPGYFGDVAGGQSRLLQLHSIASLDGG